MQSHAFTFLFLRPGDSPASSWPQSSPLSSRSQGLVSLVASLLNQFLNQSPSVISTHGVKWPQSWVIIADASTGIFRAERKVLIGLPGGVLWH